jgi:exodeoxyribonuclease V beta subunit
LLDFECGNRLLGLKIDDRGQSGERIMTDFLHLAEILQQASFTLEGQHALLRFLAEQIAAPEGETDSKKLRLESDADLIKVITIHKAKGLEYPLVFLPFIGTTRPINKNDIPLTWHDAAGKLNISLAAEPEIIERADRERLGEDLRKFYVALTRARYLTWLGLAPLEENQPSAINYLFGLSHVPATQYFEALQIFTREQPAICVTNTLTSNQEQYIAESPSTQFGEACRPQRIVKENWRISSYSALRVDNPSHVIQAFQEDTPQAENLLEEPFESPSGALQNAPQYDTSLEKLNFVHNQPSVSEQSLSMHHFFKGAQAGIFLHEIMEWLANNGFAKALDDETNLHDMIEYRCRLYQWEDWTETLINWVKQILTTSLPFGGTDVRLITLTNIKAEMEFWVAANNTDLILLDTVVIEHTLAKQARSRLTQNALNGILKGFIDLVFEYQGRYYIVDYKSNWLGMADQDYTTPAMDEVVRKNRYELQYVIYLFALHRLLQSRLSSYDYDQHVGGAACFFIRGIGAPTSGIHFERPPKALMTTLDTLFAGKIVNNV